MSGYRLYFCSVARDGLPLVRFPSCRGHYGRCKVNPLGTWGTCAQDSGARGSINNLGEKAVKLESRNLKRCDPGFQSGPGRSSSAHHISLVSLLSCPMLGRRCFPTTILKSSAALKSQTGCGAQLWSGSVQKCWFPSLGWTRKGPREPQLLPGSRSKCGPRASFTGLPRRPSLWVCAELGPAWAVRRAKRRPVDCVRRAGAATGRWGRGLRGGLRARAGSGGQLRAR